MKASSQLSIREVNTLTVEGKIYEDLGHVIHFVLEVVSVFSKAWCTMPNRKKDKKETG